MTTTTPLTPPSTTPLTHFNSAGEAHMVDVGRKTNTARLAIASGEIHMSAATLELVRDGTSKKGDVLGIARIAGITAAKKTSDLIPLCHPIALTHVAVDFTLHDDPPHIVCAATAQTVAPTGVEMEALTAVHIALLTIYDMCKAADKEMQMHAIKLLKKTGGRSDFGSDRGDGGERSSKGSLLKRFMRRLYGAKE